MSRQQPARPLNECGACRYTWHPRGRNLAARCPQCQCSDVRIARAASDLSFSDPGQQTPFSVFGLVLSSCCTLFFLVTCCISPVLSLLGGSRPHPTPAPEPVLRDMTGRPIAAKVEPHLVPVVTAPAQVDSIAHSVPPKQEEPQDVHVVGRWTFCTEDATTCYAIVQQGNRYFLEFGPRNERPRSRELTTKPSSAGTMFVPSEDGGDSYYLIAHDGRLQVRNETHRVTCEREAVVKVEFPQTREESALQFTPWDIWRAKADVEGKFVQVTGKADVEKVPDGFLLRFWNDDKTRKLVVARVEVAIEGEQVVSVAGFANSRNNTIVLIDDGLYVPDLVTTAKRIIESARPAVTGKAESGGNGKQQTSRAETSTSSGGSAVTGGRLVYGTPPAPTARKPVQVRGYTRANGTYVRPHIRAAPGMGSSRRR